MKKNYNQKVEIVKEVMKMIKDKTNISAYHKIIGEITITSVKQGFIFAKDENNNKYNFSCKDLIYHPTNDYLISLFNCDNLEAITFQKDDIVVDDSTNELVVISDKAVFDTFLGYDIHNPKELQIYDANRFTKVNDTKEIVKILTKQISNK